MTDAAAGIGRDARTIGAVTALARVAGFARTLVFAATVGTTAIGSIYQSTNTVPNVVFEVAAGGVLAAATVPLLAGRVQRGDIAEAGAIASALLTWLVAVLSPLTLALALAAPWIARLLLDEAELGPGPGDPGVGDPAVVGGLMLAVFAPQLLLYGLGVVLTGVLHAHRRFVAAALAPLVSSLVVIATYAAYGWSTRDGAAGWPDVWLLAVGTSLGVLAMVVTLLPSLRGTGFRPRPVWRFPAGVAARVRSLASAGLLALLGQQLAVVAVLWLTNHRAGVGTINGYQYVQAVVLLPYAVLAVPLATAAFPALAAADGQGMAAARTLGRALRAVLLVSGVAATALIAAAPDLGGFFTALDRGRGSAGAAALAALPATVTAFAPGIVGMGAVALLTRALYVRGGPRRASLAAAGGWLIAAVLPFVLIGGAHDTRRTLVALGIGSSVGMTVAAAGLLWLLVRSWGGTPLAGLGRAVVAVAGGAVLGIAVGRAGLTAIWSVPGADLTGNFARGLVAGLVAAGVAAGLALPLAGRDLLRRPGTVGGAAA